jgi:uncharacterized protein (DUF1330 family)
MFDHHGIGRSAESGEARMDNENKPVYSVVDVTVHDQILFQEYVDGHQHTLEKYGGKFLVAGGRFEVLEGDWNPKLLVIHQWPSRQSFDDWYGSEEYRPWEAKRHAASSANLVVVDGLPLNPVKNTDP